MHPETPTPARVARVVSASALYDLVVTAPFATPWTAHATVGLLARAHHAFALEGAPPALDGPTSLLFASLMGSLVVVWSLVRLRAPTAFHGAADTLGRLLFASWMTVALARGASTILAPLLALEVAWGLAQGLAVARALRSPRRAGMMTA